MSQDFYTLITNIGLAKLANAELSGNKVLITEIAVGDGLNGAYYNPTQNQTALKNEVWRDSVESSYIDPNNEFKVLFEAHIPSDEGGWYIREVGAFDADGDLIAISKVAESYKPTNQQGGADEYIIRVPVLYSNASILDIYIDPAVVMASRQYVDQRIIRGNIRPEGHITANKGVIYEYLSTGDIYRKTSDNSNTGWKQLNRNDLVHATDFGTGALTSAVLLAAISAIGSNNMELYCSGGVWNISEDIVFPENIVVKFAKGAVLNVANGVTVTINNIIKFPNEIDQIFNCVGTGKVILSKYSDVIPDWFGAVRDDPSIDSSSAILKTIEAIGEGLVRYLKGTYYVGTKINHGNNITHFGMGEGITTIRDHADLGSNQIFHIEGSSGSRISGVKFKNITIVNGTASTNTYTAGKDGIRAEYVDYLQIKNCEITDIQGCFGIATKYSTNIKIKDCNIHDYTYSGITILVECEDIHIKNNIVRDPKALNTTQNYCIATGGEVYGEGSFWVKNLWIENNRVSGNLRYQGINSHGGENMWIKNNYVEDCKIGIHVTTDRNYLTDPTKEYSQNIHIENNICSRGVADAGGWGIYGGGYNWKYDKNFIIKGNSITGFGGDNNANIGALHLSGVNGGVIENNFINEFYTVGIILNQACVNVLIDGNIIKNAAGRLTGSGYAYGIRCSSYGHFNVFARNNTITYDDVSKYITHGIVGQQYTSNMCVDNTNHINATVYKTSYCNAGFSAAPTARFWKYGDIVFDAKYKPLSYCTGNGSLITGYFGWFNAADTIKIQGEAGSSVVKINGSITEAGDTANQLSNWYIFSAGKGNSDIDIPGKLYWSLTNSGTTRTVSLYKDSDKTELVAEGSLIGDGTITLAEQNDSNITGFVDVAYTVDDIDSGNTILSVNFARTVPPQLNIVITGAGTAGGDLTTLVMDSDMEGYLTLKDEIETTVTNATITAVTSTFTA